MSCPTCLDNQHFPQLHDILEFGSFTYAGKGWIHRIVIGVASRHAFETGSDVLDIARKPEAAITRHQPPKEYALMNA